MRRDRQLGRNRSNFESNVYHYEDEWDDKNERHGQAYTNHRSTTTITSDGVGRRSGDQVTSRTIRNGNPQQSQFSRRIIREDEQDTEDGSSSVISYSSATGYVHPQSNKIQNNNRTNYHEPTVRVHYVSQEESSNPRFYSQSNHHSHSDYLSPSSRMPDIPERFRDEKDESEMYVTDSTFRKQRPPGSVYSHYSTGNKSRAPSEMSSVKTKTSRQGGVVVETMAAPNPFCPNTKGVCCLMVLVNLGLILVTLGFSIVLQLYDPPFVWYCGIAFLIVGFIGLIASLVFCVYLCRESRDIQRAQGRNPGELYWTHHWQKRIPIPAMGGRGEREKDDLSTVYSARTDYDDRNHTDKFYVATEKDRNRTPQPIHTYRN